MGRCTDAAGRLKDVLFRARVPWSGRGASRGETDLAPPGLCRFRWHGVVTEMTVVVWLPWSVDCAAPGILQAVGAM